jgi:hypothetical protein
VHVDDLRIAYEANAGPNFLDTTPSVWSRDPRWLCESLIDSTRHLHQPIATAIDQLLGMDHCGIIEGEGIEPSAIAHEVAVRAVYVIEDDADRLAATFVARPSRDRYLALSDREQAAVVEMNRLYSMWLRSEAELHAQPWVAAQPWESLADRVLDAIDTP